MNESHLFKLARECSLKSDYSGCGHARVGAIISYKGSVLAKGFNTDRTHTDQAKYNKWRYKNSDNKYLPDKCHAECAAISKIKYLDIDFSRAHLYVYRELRDGSIAMARPCPACMAAIKQIGLKHLHYTSNEGYCHEKILYEAKEKIK